MPLLLPQTRTYTQAHKHTHTHTHTLVMTTADTQPLVESSVLAHKHSHLHFLLSSTFSLSYLISFPTHTHRHTSHWFCFMVGCGGAQRVEGGGIAVLGPSGGCGSCGRVRDEEGWRRCWWGVCGVGGVQEDGVVFLQVSQQQQRGALTVLVHSLCSPFHQVELKTWSPCEYQWMCLENLLPRC